MVRLHEYQGKQLLREAGVPVPSGKVAATCMHAMKEYIRDRTIQGVATIFVVMIISFLLFRILPGDPIRMMYKDPRFPLETVNRLKRQFGLDQPLHVQFVIYLVNSLKGNLGLSFVYRVPVAEIVAERLVNSLILVGTSCILSIMIGFLMGVFAAWKRGSKIDKFLTNFSLGMYSVPVFWIGMLMMIVFAVKLKIFPTSGMFTCGVNFSGPLDYLWDGLWHFALPSITLTLVWIGVFSINIRSSMLDVLTEDYMVTAKAKGLNSLEMIKDHALKNALLPLVTLIAMNLGMVVAGAIQIETIFAWPGIGRLMYEALLNRDYPILQGTLIVISISVVVANFIADILYSYLDPRVRT